MSHLIQLFLLLFSTSASLVWSQPAPIALDIKGVARPHVARRGFSDNRDTKQVIPVTFDNQATVYTANVTIGTPPQPFALVLEFDYADTVVIARSSAATTSETWTTGRYNANDSSTYQYLNSRLNIVPTSKGNTLVTGDFIAETMTIGGTTVSNVQMAVAYRGTMPNLYLGLGYNTPQTTSGEYPNLITTLYQTGQLACEAYSLWINNIDAPTGQLLLGGIDTGKFEGTLETLPIQTSYLLSNYVVLILSSLTFPSANNVPVVTDSMPVMFGAWTNYIYLPQNVTQPLFARLNMTYSDSLGYASGICDDIDNSTTLDFQLGSQKITLLVGQLVTYYATVGNSHFCSIYIVPSTSPPYWLGVTFLELVYMVFDLTHNTISLAPVASNNWTGNVTTIPAGGVAGFVSTANVGGSTTNTTGSTTNATGSNNGTTPSRNGSGLSTGAKPGIGVGVGIGAILVLALIGF